jgi:glycosyltransferase involved in cell wall biosynthesis
MRAIEARGHRIVPIVINLREGPAQAADRLLAARANVVAGAGGSSALATLLSPGPKALRAFSFLARQKRLKRRSLLWNAMKIAAIGRAAGCDHFHAHFSGGAAAHAIVAARWIGASVSFVCHGHDVYAEAEDLPLKLAAADGVVAVCNDMADDLARLAPRAGIATVPCGADHRAFQARGKAGAFRRLLFVGRLVEQKGIDDLLSALALSPEIGVDLVGDGPLLEPLRAQAEALGLGDRVAFLGGRPREWLIENAPNYFGLVAPFKEAPDGARDSGPMVVKEAMAMGMPVVATRFMGLKEMVTPATGFLADPGDPLTIAEAMAALLGLSAAERAEMGRRARARMVEVFSLDATTRKLSNLFEAS